MSDDYDDGVGHGGPYTRHGDPDTSHEAARKAGKNKTEIQIAVLCAFKHRKMTDLDLHQHFGSAKISTHRSRRNELTNDRCGYIRNSGLKKFQNDSNRIVWEITEAGLSFLASIGK